MVVAGLTIDCIPHALMRHANPLHYSKRHSHHLKPIAKIVVATPAKAHAPRRHVRLRECAPNAAMAPLADLDIDNIVTIYTLPYAIPGSPANGQAASIAAGPDATPAEASGLDLPLGGFGNIGALGGGGGVIGLPPGTGGSGGGGSGSSGGGGGGGGGSGGGGGGSGGGSSGGGGTTGTGGGGGSGSGPVIGLPPTTGGGGSTTGPGGLGGGDVQPGVPEPATWALMVIGVGAIGGLMRRGRRLGVSA
jgi:hypothetical protein